MLRSLLVALLAAGCFGVCLTACEREQTPADTTHPRNLDDIGLDEAASDEDLLESGRGIAETHCVACHAIGVADESPRADAPPLRTVLQNYDAEALAHDFRERLEIGHADMPDYDFGPIGTDGLIAYLQSIQVN